VFFAVVAIGPKIAAKVGEKIVMAVKLIVRPTPILELPEMRVNEDVVEAVHLAIHLLRPASMAAFLMAVWRFTADLGWASSFLIADGLGSHWQLWAVLGVAMMAISTMLERRLGERESREMQDR
jgi:hypothetical protein